MIDIHYPQEFLKCLYYAGLWGITLSRHLGRQRDRISVFGVYIALVSQTT